MLYACFLTTIITLALFCEAVMDKDERGIYDYSTGFIDMILFTLASMYFVSGSYEEKKPQENIEVAASV